MKFKWWFYILAAVFAAPLNAQEISLTVYNQDRTLVREIRKVAIESGTRVLAINDVAEKMDPSSVLLRPVKEGDSISILEQSFEYDLADSNKLLSLYLGQKIRAYNKEGKMFDGRLIGVSGDLVLENADGSLQSVNRNAIQNIEYPKPASAFALKPTLAWMVNSKESGEKEMELSYLTQGIGWHAEYTGVLDKDEKKLMLSAWVSIENNSGADYTNAKLKIISGDVHRADRVVRPRFAVGMAMAEMAQPNAFEQESFAEYYRYTLPRLVSLKNQQTKQLELFPAAEINVRKIYQYDANEDAKNIRASLEFTNSKSEGLGVPLPEGKIRIYQMQDLIGEDTVAHTPKDEKLKLILGNVFDIVGEHKIKETKKLGEKARQDTYQIVLRNRKENDAEVLVKEHFSGDWEIVKSSIKPEKKDAESAEFKVFAKKNSEAVLEYTVVTKW